MTLVYTVLAVEFVFLLYFLGLHGTYLALNLISVMSLPRYVQSRVLDRYPQGHSEFDLPISVIAPAYNEQTCIVSSVRSLLQLSYSAFELVVVNDGSKDETLEVLIREFNLVSFPEAYRIRIPTKQVRGIYTSR